MKKANLILLVVIAGIGFSYLLYKSWVVFGWWTLTWTVSVSMFSRSLLENLTSARSESNGTITFIQKSGPST